MPSFGRSLPNAVDVQQALVLLHEHPHGSADALDDPAQQGQEDACKVIFLAFVPRLMKVCQCHGQGPDEAPDIIYPLMNSFVTRDITRVPPVSERAFAWLSRSCVHRIASLRRRSSIMARIKRRLFGEEGVDGMEAEPAATLDSSAPPLETPTDDARWLDVRMPAGVSTKHWMQAFARLSPADRAFYDVLVDRLATERSESDSPRTFDQQPYRLQAARVAELLGSTPNAVSVRWAKIQKKLCLAVSKLRAKELRAQGHSLPTIRARLAQLGLSGAEVDKVLSKLRLLPAQLRGGVK